MVNRLERALVPFVATSIALVQFYLAHAVGLTQWKGGGFGMFSTIDTPFSRAIRCEVRFESGEVGLIVFEDANTRMLVDRLKAIPFERDARFLARRIMLQKLQSVSASRLRLRDRLHVGDGGPPFPEYRIDSSPQSFVILPGELAAANDPIVQSVRVEVHRIHWDSIDRSVDFQPVLDREYRRTELL